jgi:hypothetical protein
LLLLLSIVPDAVTVIGSSAAVGVIPVDPLVLMILKRLPKPPYPY